MREMVESMFGLAGRMARRNGPAVNLYEAAVDGGYTFECAVAGYSKDDIPRRVAARSGCAFGCVCARKDR
jgi:hypothetical protein